MSDFSILPRAMVTDFRGSSQTDDAIASKYGYSIAPIPVDPPVPPVPTDMIRLAYMMPDAAATASIKAFGERFSHVSADCFGFNNMGKISGMMPTWAMGECRAQGKPIYACISNYSEALGDFSQPNAHAVLTNAIAKAAFLANIRNLMSSGNYAGVNLDFESIRAADRRSFTLLCDYVAASIAPLQLIVSCPTKEADDPADSWSGWCDYVGIAKYATHLQIMTYDQHGSWDKEPGPVAGLDWQKRALTYAVGAVGANKIIMGIPAYGYDWNVTANRPSKNVQVTWKDIPALLAKYMALPKFDIPSSSPWFSYTDGNGAKHTVWYEDAYSVNAKVNLAMSMGLAGISMWALGFEDAVFWAALS